MILSFHNPRVEAYADALPAEGKNPIGNLARTILVNTMKGATPGRCSSALLEPEKPTFREVFFPNYRPMEWEEDVQPVTGIDPDTWSELSVAVLCEAMYNIMSRVRPRLLIDKIRSDIGNQNECIRSNLSGWYAFMCPRATSDIKTTYEKLDDRDAALKDYIDGIQSNVWINAKQTQYATGNWPNHTWELYHHWVKMKALGASDADIDALINTRVVPQ